MVQRDRIGACVIAWLVGGGLSFAGQDPDPRPPVETQSQPVETREQPVPALHAKGDFAGIWDYNADESIDIRRALRSGAGRRRRWVEVRREAHAAGAAALVVIRPVGEAAASVATAVDGAAVPG
jgi:hypothetical protein